MNHKSIYKKIISGEKGPRIAGRTILGIILVGTFLLTAAIVYSRAATPQTARGGPAVNASLISSPELMLARRYAAAQNQAPFKASLAANPELILARRYAAGKKPAEATLLAANRELSFARHNGINQNQAAIHADLSTNPELILVRRFGKEMEKNAQWEYLADNPELFLVHRYASTLSKK